MGLVKKLKGVEKLQLVWLFGCVISCDEDGRELLINLFVQYWIFQFFFDVEIVFEFGSFFIRGDRLLGFVFESFRNYYSDQFDRKFEEKFILVFEGFINEEVCFV